MIPPSATNHGRTREHMQELDDQARKRKEVALSIQHVQPSQDPVAQQLDNVLATTIHREATQQLRDQRRSAAATSISEPQQSLNSQPSSSWQHRV